MNVLYKRKKMERNFTSAFYCITNELGTLVFSLQTRVRNISEKQWQLVDLKIHWRSLGNTVASTHVPFLVSF